MQLANVVGEIRLSPVDDDCVSVERITFEEIWSRIGSCHDRARIRGFDHAPVHHDDSLREPRGTRRAQCLAHAHVERERDGQAAMREDEAVPNRDAGDAQRRCCVNRVRRRPRRLGRVGGPSGGDGLGRNALQVVVRVAAPERRGRPLRWRDRQAQRSHRLQRTHTRRDRARAAPELAIAHASRDPDHSRARKRQYARSRSTWAWRLGPARCALFGVAVRRVVDRLRSGPPHDPGDHGGDRTDLHQGGIRQEQCGDLHLRRVDRARQTQGQREEEKFRAGTSGVRETSRSTMSKLIQSGSQPRAISTVHCKPSKTILKMLRAPW